LLENGSQHSLKSFKKSSLLNESQLSQANSIRNGEVTKSPFGFELFMVGMLLNHI
jgi:hypothetical protein